MELALHTTGSLSGPSHSVSPVHSATHTTLGSLDSNWQCGCLPRSLTCVALPSHKVPPITVI